MGWLFTYHLSTRRGDVLMSKLQGTIDKATKQLEEMG